MLSVQEEKALVLRISKLQRLKSEETALLEARRKRSGMDFELHRKLLEQRKHLRHDLQSEMQDIIDVRVDSFPQPADEPEYCTPEWVEKHIIRPQMALGSFDDETLRQFCPRLERRNVFRASKARKSAGKGSEKSADGHTGRKSQEPQEPAPRVTVGKVRSRNPGRLGRTGRPGRRERRRSRLDQIRNELEMELCWTLAVPHLDMCTVYSLWDVYARREKVLGCSDSGCTWLHMVAHGCTGRTNVFEKCLVTIVHATCAMCWGPWPSAWWGSSQRNLRRASAAYRWNLAACGHLSSLLLRKVGCDPLSNKKAAFKLEAKSKRCHSGNWIRAAFSWVVCFQNVLKFI